MDEEIKDLLETSLQQNDEIAKEKISLLSGILLQLENTIKKLKNGRRNKGVDWNFNNTKRWK